MMFDQKMFGFSLTEDFFFFLTLKQNCYQSFISTKKKTQPLNFFQPAMFLMEIYTLKPEDTHTKAATKSYIWNKL